jgi:hypothetical protein
MDAKRAHRFCIHSFFVSSGNCSTPAERRVALIDIQLASEFRKCWFAGASTRRDGILETGREAPKETRAIAT